MCSHQVLSLLNEFSTCSQSSQCVPQQLTLSHMLCSMMSSWNLHMWAISRFVSTPSLYNGGISVLVQLVPEIEIETLFIQGIKMTWFWCGKLDGYMVFALKIQLEFVTMFNWRRISWFINNPLNAELFLSSSLGTCTYFHFNRCQFWYAKCVIMNLVMSWP
jgi:hypothetical protein